MYPLNLDAWNEWVEFRHKEKRKKIGDMAKVKQQKMLTQYTPEQQQEIIDQSIMNSWQGLFPPKGDTNGRNHIRSAHTRGPRVVTAADLFDAGHDDGRRTLPQFH